ncbi:MAG: hypothetical protein FJZ01_00495 [Candidatus Sericytochromatia bacterium]|nr:hypothetical protein [Candidatus Tanganyikabacteria bacterium]
MPLLGLAFLAAVASPPPDLLRTLSPEEEARVNRGGVVVQMERGSERIKRYQVVGNVEAPVARVWEVYTDFGRYNEIFQITGSQIRRQSGNTIYGWFYLALFWPIGPRWTLNETVLFPERFTFTYQRVEGTFKQYEGDLELSSIAQARTRVRYSAKIDPDAPMIPAWVLDYVQFTMLPTTITRVRDWIAGDPARAARR